MKAVYFAMLLLVTVVGCGIFDVDVDRSDEASSFGTISFSGEITINQGEGVSWDELNLSLSKDEPMTGTLFRKSDGAVGTIYGSRTDRSAVFSGSIDCYCPGDIDQGTINVIDDNSIDLRLEGSDCNGPFTIAGVLRQIQCLDLQGKYFAVETLSVDYTVGSESGQINVQGSGELLLAQDECDVSFSVPGGVAVREGTIAGGVLRMSGAFVIPYGEDITISENSFVLEVPLDDTYDFAFSGSGKARGTVDGQSFYVEGQTVGRLVREFDLAVAMLRGGAASGSGMDSEWVDLIKQVKEGNNGRVITKFFPEAAGIFGDSQIEKVETWLNSVTENGSKDVKVLLVGHSAGGHALVTVGESSQQFQHIHMDSRITLDPFDPSRPFVVQRDPYNPTAITRPQGWFANYLAEKPNGWGWLGYHVVGGSEDILIPSTHDNIVEKIVKTGYVGNEARRLLGSVSAPPMTLPISHNLPVPNRETRLGLSFGWKSVSPVER